jgi:hypothetical protein
MSATRFCEPGNNHSGLVALWCTYMKKNGKAAAWLVLVCTRILVRPCLA